MCRLDEVSDYFSNIEHIRFHPPEKVGWVPVQFSSELFWHDRVFGGLFDVFLHGLFFT